MKNNSIERLDRQKKTTLINDLMGGLRSYETIR